MACFLLLRIIKSTVFSRLHRTNHDMSNLTSSMASRECCECQAVSNARREVPRTDNGSDPNILSDGVNGWTGLLTDPPYIMSRLSPTMQPPRYNHMSRLIDIITWTHFPPCLDRPQPALDSQTAFLYHREPFALNPIPDCYWIKQRPGTLVTEVCLVDYYLCPWQ